VTQAVSSASELADSADSPVVVVHASPSTISLLQSACDRYMREEVA
jgi:hypothetical protein